MRSPTYIMIHHSLTEDSQTVSWAAIERYHREINGWRDIGYHAGVELIGDTYYSLLGRDLALTAAACLEAAMNLKALHVCVVGNYDAVPPPEPALEILIRRVLRPWMREFNITWNNVVGHREYATYKTCPGRLFDLDSLRARLEAG